jgi:hypothetical protein
MILPNWGGDRGGCRNADQTLEDNFRGMALGTARVWFVPSLRDSLCKKNAAPDALHPATPTEGGSGGPGAGVISASPSTSLRAGSSGLVAGVGIRHGQSWRGLRFRNCERMPRDRPFAAFWRGGFHVVVLLGFCGLQTAFYDFVADRSVRATQSGELPAMRGILSSPGCGRFLWKMLRTWGK